MGINIIDFLLGLCVGASIVLLAWLYEIGKEIDRLTKEIEEEIDRLTKEIEETVERLGLKKKT